MITSNLLYQMYIEILNLKINELLEENISYHTVHSNLMEKLYDYNPYIELCTNYSLNELLKFTDLHKFNKIYFSTDKVYIDNIVYSKDILNLYLKNYIEINKIVIRNEERVNKLKSQRLDYKLYYNIIKRFNKGITDSMIEEGYVFNPGDAFGKLFISKVVSEEPRWDKPRSMIARRKLIAEGKRPYNEKEEKEFLDKGLKYDGIKYFVYYPKIDFMVTWRRGEIIRKYFPFIAEFKYRPPHTDFDSSYHAKMRNFIRNNMNKALILYDRGEYERA